MLTRLYLGGPMRGKPLSNFPAFDEAAGDLRRTGAYEVFNPAEKDRELYQCDAAEMETVVDLRVVLGYDTAWICAHSEGMALLPDWEISAGARAEKALHHALGLPVRTVDEWLTLWATTPTLRGGITC